MEDETAWVQSGTTLGELYYAIANKSKVHGFPAGSCATIGIGRHLSGAWKIKLVQVPSTVTIFEVSKNLDDGGSEIFTKWQTVAPKLSVELFGEIGVALDFMFKLWRVKLIP
ncbi:hypothetical protein AHAS_Ahas19G0256200 [Arachis hypogaea]